MNTDGVYNKTRDNKLARQSFGGAPARLFMSTDRRGRTSGVAASERRRHGVSTYIRRRRLARISIFIRPAAAAAAVAACHAGVYLSSSVYLMRPPPGRRPQQAPAGYVSHVTRARAEKMTTREEEE